MSKILAAFSALLSLGLITAEGSGFTAGNIVVVRVGDGSAALSAAATPVFLQEYTPAGAVAQTIPLPIATFGANNPFTLTGNATSEGFLKRSADGGHLTLAGYATTPGTASVSGTTSATVNRTVAVINSNDVVDTSTLLPVAYSGSNIRSAVSTDGTQIWTGGNSSSSTGAGIQYTTLGQHGSTQILSTPNNLRCVDIAGGQLYLSSGSSPFTAVATVGTGEPTMSGNTATTLSGLPTTGASPYDYCFVGSTTLYIADDRSVASGGGIQKWTLSNGVWSLQYTLGNASCRGLTYTLAADGTTVILYATTTATSANTLISVTDTGAGAVPTIIATAAANTVFRGVAMSLGLAPIQRPSLAIGRSGGNVVVSWPSPSTGWLLQSNLDLTTTNWGNSGATVNDDGTNRSVMIVPGGRQFFRLIH